MSSSVNIPEPWSLGLERLINSDLFVEAIEYIHAKIAASDAYSPADLEKMAELLCNKVDWQALVDKYIDKRQISLPLTKESRTKPKASIIIPVYGKSSFTKMCIFSVVISKTIHDYEIIVVNDKPDDDSLETWKFGNKYCTYLQNPENVGFIMTCNRGAEAASGDYLIFLNNDTYVLNNWLDALLQTFDDFPQVGLVGSKLIYPDGTLQEAGGILWSDGSGWNYGKNQDADLPCFNYAREVDYCSGASIAIPKLLFNEIGGFDTLYRPAYCEDSDLAITVRSKGYSVIYQPLSILKHYEGITSGRDLTKGVKSYQVANFEKLYTKWREYFSELQENGHNVDVAKDWKSDKRVLLIDHCTPCPDSDAGSLTTFNTMIILRDMGFQVTFIPEDNFYRMPKYTTLLQQNGIEALYSPSVTTVRDHVEECGDRYDLVFLFRPEVAHKHIDTISKYCKNAKILYHTIDLHFLRMEREFAMNKSTAEMTQIQEIKEKELLAISKSDASIVHSTEEYEILKGQVDEQRLHVFPLILSTNDSVSEFIDRDGIVFVGGYRHMPNVDAVQYFSSEVMPIISVMDPHIKFHIVGSHMPDEIKDLSSDNIIVHGFIDDLTDFLGKRRVSIAPLRYGAGIKGKIGTAMASGLPVVASTIASEGMNLSAGKNILIADSPIEFANSIVHLYKDSQLWNSISKNGIDFARKEWGPDASCKRLVSILNNLSINCDLPEITPNLYTYK